MGNQKQKWTAEEEEALKEGVGKHGPGKWKNIIVDIEFAPILSNRSNVALKDKWRNMGANHGHSGRDKSTTPKAKAITSSAEAPKTEKTSTFSSKVKADDNLPRSPQNNKNVLKYNPMIFEALSSLQERRGSDISAIVGFIEKKHEVPQNFRKLLSSKLRNLVLQGKLEKVQQCYKIIDAALGTKTPTPKQKDIRPRPQKQSILTTSGKVVEHAVKAAAHLIAEAERKAVLAAEVVIESERVSQMAEDAQALLTLSREVF